MWVKKGEGLRVVKEKNGIAKGWERKKGEG
jgi:hypothetical protein